MRYEVVVGGIVLRLEVARGSIGQPEGYGNGHHRVAPGLPKVGRLAAGRRGQRKGRATASTERNQAYLERERLLAAARSASDYWARTLLTSGGNRDLR